MFRYSVGKTYQCEGDETPTAPVFVAEGNFLTDMQAVVKNRLHMTRPLLDDKGREANVTYTIFANGTPIQTYTH